MSRSGQPRARRTPAAAFNRFRRSAALRGTVFGLALVALVVGAVVYPGFKTTEVELNDGGVWVVSK
ncbi:hypothetical protein, partial [Arthrobacter sp. Leaf141]